MWLKWQKLLQRPQRRSSVTVQYQEMIAGIEMSRVVFGTVRSAVHNAEQHISRERLPRQAVVAAALGHRGTAAVDQARERGSRSDGAALPRQRRGRHQRRRAREEPTAVPADHREDRRRPAQVHDRLHPLSQRPAECE